MLPPLTYGLLNEVTRRFLVTAQATKRVLVFCSISMCNQMVTSEIRK